ncbi:MAG: hypothetical protein RLY86_195 [Pseudomonadota bacterium]|jgi:hypothetical protein
MGIEPLPHPDPLPLRHWDDGAEEPFAGEDRPFDDLSDEDLFGPVRKAAPKPPGGDAMGGAAGGLTAGGLTAGGLTAALSLGRLDARLRDAPPPVRAGWQARMLLAEAAASARLDGHLLDPDDLLAWECGFDRDGPPSPALSAGLQILDMLRLSARRSARSFWTPRRLLRLAGMVETRRRREPEDLPAWLRAQRGDRDGAVAALTRLLQPDRIEGWKALPPLIASARIIQDWTAEGLADMAGGSVGRLLAAAWPWRMGELPGLVLPCSRGFLGHAADHAPWRPDWPDRWLGAVGRGALWGNDLMLELTRAHQRLTVACEGRRKSSRLPQLASLLIERPALGSGEVAEALGATKQGALNLLEELAAAGLVREISRRDSHWVWQISPA